MIIDRVKKYYPISRICKVLDIDRRSYYKWLSNGSPLMNNFSLSVANIIMTEHTRLNGIYGALRLKAHIERKYNIVLNHKRVRRYKDIFNFKTLVRKRKSLAQKLNAKEKIFKNKVSYILACDFMANKPRTKLSTDVSYIKCTNGILYLSALKDLYNKEKVKLGSSAIINTDQGYLYYFYEYIKISKDLNFTRSMSHKEHCWENGPIEN